MSGNRAVPAARADAIFLQFRVREFYMYGAPTSVGIGLRVVAQKVQMSKILTDGSEGVTLVFPVFCEISFPAGVGRHAPENRRGSRVQPGLARTDHVNRDSFRLGQLIHVLRGA